MLTGAIVRTAGFEGQGGRATVLTVWHDFHEGRPATGGRPDRPVGAKLVGGGSKKIIGGHK